jgi:excisionase family DNA binding protein
MVCLNNYITPKEAADAIGCTTGRIYQLLREGGLKDVLRVGKHPMISR